MRITAIALVAVFTSLTVGCEPRKYIGEAKMDEDGVIHAWLRAELPDGGHGDSFMKIHPRDESYQEWLKHLKGLKPGETKPIPPWPPSASSFGENRKRTMSVNVLFDDADGYLLACTTGEWDIKALRQSFRDIADAAEKRGYSRILMDSRQLSPPRTGFDRFVAGKEIAHIFKFHFKVAAVYPAGLINKFAENAAVNRSANFLVVSEMDEALKWLTES